MALIDSFDAREVVSPPKVVARVLLSIPAARPGEPTPGGSVVFFLTPEMRPRSSEFVLNPLMREIKAGEYVLVSLPYRDPPSIESVLVPFDAPKA